MSEQLSPQGIGYEFGFLALLPPMKLSRKILSLISLGDIPSLKTLSIQPIYEVKLDREMHLTH